IAAHRDAVEDIVRGARADVARGANEAEVNALAGGDGGVVARVPDLDLAVALADKLCVPDLRNARGKVKLQVPAVDGLGAGVGERDAAREGAAPVAILHELGHDRGHLARFELLKERTEFCLGKATCPLAAKLSLKDPQET